MPGGLEPYRRCGFPLESHQRGLGCGIELSDAVGKLRPLNTRFGADPLQRLFDPSESRERASAGGPLIQQLLNGEAV